MDREIPVEIVRRRRLRRGAVVAGVVVAAMAALAVAGDMLRPSVQRSEIRLAEVGRGSMLATLDATGTVLPRYERVITSPVDARIVEILKRAGEPVSAGSPIVSLDVSAMKSELTKIERQLAIRNNDRSQIRLDIEGELRTLEAQLEQRRLDAEMLGYRAAQDRQLRDEGLIADEAVKLSEIAARKAEIEVAQTEKAIERLQRNRAIRLAGVDLDASLLESDRSDTLRQLEQAAAAATGNGVVTWVTPEVGAMVRRGDPVARIAGTDAFRIEGTISDIHAASVLPGAEVVVRAGQDVLRGEVESVEPAVSNGAVRFHVRLQQPDHPALRPNRRVDLELVTGRRDNAIQVERGQLLTHSQRYVWVVDGDRAVRREVRIGITSPDRVELLEGVAPGETVIVGGLIGLGEPPTIRIR